MAAAATTLTDRMNLRGWIWAVPPVALVFLAHLWFGANSTFAALVLSAAETLLLLSLLSRARFRATLMDAGLGWAIPAAFAAVLSVAALSLFAVSPAWAHPVWSYTPGPPATALNRSAAITEIVKLLGLAAIFVVGLVLSLARASARPLRKGLLWAGAAYALVALALFLGRGTNGQDGRLTGNLTSANSAATIFGILVVLVLPMLLSPEDRGHRGSRIEAILLARAPAAALVLLFGASLVLTASRGGMLSTLAAVFALLLLQLNAGRIRLNAAVAVWAVTAVCLAGLMLAKGSLMIERFGGMAMQDDPRADIYAKHWSAFLQSPILGYGMGGFSQLNRLLIDAAGYHATWSIRDLHNVYLQWLEEAGIIGALPMFVCIGLVIATALTAAFRRKERTWLRALIAADVLVLFHGMTDYALQEPSIASMWALLLGVQLGLAKGPQQREVSGVKQTPTYSAGPASGPRHPPSPQRFSV